MIQAKDVIGNFPQQLMFHAAHWMGGTAVLGEWEGWEAASDGFGSPMNDTDFV